MLRDILAHVRSQEDAVTFSRLTTSAPRTFAGPAGARPTMYESLATAGVLATPGHPSMLDGFVPQVDRWVVPTRSDACYPAYWWRGSSGVDEHAVGAWFGHLLRGRAPRVRL